MEGIAGGGDVGSVPAWDLGDGAFIEYPSGNGDNIAIAHHIASCPLPYTLQNSIKREDEELTNAYRSMIYNQIEAPAWIYIPYFGIPLGAQNNFRLNPSVMQSRLV